MTSLQLPPKGWREWEKKDIFSFPSKQNIAYCPWFYLISIWDTHISMLKNLIMWDVTYTLCKPKPKRPHDQNICQPLDNGNSKESPDISWLRVIQRQKTHSLTGGQGHPPSATLCLLNVIRKERKKKRLWPLLTHKGSYFFGSNIQRPDLLWHGKGLQGLLVPRYNRKVGSK